MFHHQLAWQMINNSWIQAEEKRAQEGGIVSVLQLMTLPLHAKHYRIVSGIVLQLQGTSSTCADTIVGKKGPIVQACQELKWNGN
jgi:hypothetical protein